MLRKISKRFYRIPGAEFPKDVNTALRKAAELANADIEAAVKAPSGK
ncbi:hypothetical protein [Paenibacillus sp. RC67]|nr:hypothetical protein [Paenibacillus sp. RC67]